MARPVRIDRSEASVFENLPGSRHLKRRFEANVSFAEVSERFAAALRRRQLIAAQKCGQVRVAFNAMLAATTTTQTLTSVTTATTTTTTTTTATTDATAATAAAVPVSVTVTAVVAAAIVVLTTAVVVTVIVVIVVVVIVVVAVAVVVAVVVVKDGIDVRHHLCMYVRRRCLCRRSLYCKKMIIYKLRLPSHTMLATWYTYHTGTHCNMKT
jgi:hypothetical protein